MNEFNQLVTFKIYPQAHVKADGTNTIYLRVTIERKKKEINLHTYWPIAFFDLERQIALPRHAKDAEVAQVNMIIEEARGRAHRIKLRYFTDAKRLTLDLFAKDFENYESRDNFIFYWTNKLEDDFNAGAITYRTWQGHTSNINRLKLYTKSEVLSISDITPDLVVRYFNWLLKNKEKPLKYNSALKAVKTMQTYLLKAKADGMKINEAAFDKVPKSYRPGAREALEEDEMQRLIKLFIEQSLPVMAQEVLRKFLFSCITGLRISDSAQISASMIKNGLLTVKMKKGERYGKEVTIKLPPFAKELIAGRKGLLFLPLVDQTVNKYLKEIAGKAGIDKRLTFHVSRDTFATLFIESGGDVGTLKQLMGHSSINTTQIYMKMSEKRAEKLMDNFGDMFKIKPE
jgi:integrase/recombinase XerD